MYSTSVFKHKQVEAYIQPAIKQLAPLARRYEAELKKATQDPSAADNGGRNGKDEL